MGHDKPEIYQLDWRQNESVLDQQEDSGVMEYTDDSGSEISMTASLKDAGERTDKPYGFPEKY